MASHLGIAGAAEAVVRMLRSNYEAADFNGPVLDFQVYVAKNFDEPMDQGVSLFVYRVYHNGAQRTPPGRLLPDGSRQRHQLPVDLHFLLTAWARTASLQHEIAGWMMRVMEDQPMLPAALLNAYRSDVFHNDEVLEIAPSQLTVEEVFRIWEVMIDHDYQLSVPYVIRMLQIESMATKPSALPVQERVGRYGVVEHSR
jgi:hypothetical protein